MIDWADLAARGIGWLVLAVAFLGLLWIAYRVIWGPADKRLAEQEMHEQLERTRMVEEQAAQMLPGWRPGLCVMCGKAKATQPMPIITHSRLDRNIGGYRSLHAQMPMYVLTDDKEATLCLPDRRVIERRKDGRLAAIRARHALINTQTEDEIRQIETELVAEVRRELAVPEMQFIEAPQLTGRSQAPPSRIGVMTLPSSDDEPPVSES